ncbi:Fe-S cluster assembly protein SufD [Anthocerotibacter panamensis]|uniref:Fe-S cluster assembly protein SufD n=1 Tax=Anthocerotibacter panamensis TaxID=2857077 RepID=UPI001C40549D|nr:Fe-S cluster assembly protein SufD [Anthocerotibacter panamensis]
MTAKYAAEIHPLAGENRLLADCLDVPTEPLALRQRRRRARDRFRALGFPTTRQEAWRHTNIAPLTKIPFAPAQQKLLTAEALRPYTYPETIRLVFVNGFFAPEHSDTLPQDCVLGSLAHLLTDAPERVAAHVGRYAGVEEQTFTALNTACWRDGAFLYVPPAVVLNQPIHLIYVAVTGEEATVSYPRTSVVLGVGAEATVLETYTGWGVAPYFTCPVTELVLEEDAILDYYLLQREQSHHLGALQIHLARDSVFTGHSLDLGGSLVRHDLTAVLDGEGCSCTLDGLYLVDRGQHTDNHLRVDHTRPQGTSLERYRGILAGDGQAVFKGNIRVHPQAQKTHAQQTNRNLLLSDEALVHTNPQLEILANDVKCSHGATVGQLDQDALFYLRSRGLGETEAHQLLVYAFASDILGGIRIEAVRTSLEALLLAQCRQIKE